MCAICCPSPWMPCSAVREHPELYQVGRGEQRVLLVEPYKSEFLPHSHKAAGDFVGMDMVRKFLQMGYTRSRRYANHGDIAHTARSTPRGRTGIGVPRWAPSLVTVALLTPDRRGKVDTPACVVPRGRGGWSECGDRECTALGCLAVVTDPKTASVLSRLMARGDPAVAAGMRA